MRLVARFVAALVAVVAPVACGSVPLPSPPANDPGLVVVTAGGEALVDGADDLPPTLDLRVSASSSLAPGDVAVGLDGHVVATSADGRGVRAVTTPLPLGSAHTLALGVPGRATATYHVLVVRPAAALAALHPAAGGGVTLDLAFALAPTSGAVTDALPRGGTGTWTDPTHLGVHWSAAPGGRLHLPATLATSRGSHLAADLDLALDPLTAADGPIRSVTVPPPPAPGVLAVLGFGVGTAASRASFAQHAGQLSEAAPTGLTVDASGALGGEPDPAETAAARAAGVDLLPVVQQADATTAAALARDPAAAGRLAGDLRDAAAAGGWAGAQLDVENLPVDAAPGYAHLVATVALALHAAGRRLAVDVVPHKPGRTTSTSEGYDLGAIGAAADEVVLMEYEQHGPGTAAGPVAGVDWQDELLAGSLGELGTHARLLLGVPLYARAWTPGDGATADSYASALGEALARPGARVDLDPVAHTPVVRTGDGTQVWFDDATSLLWKVDLAHRRGLAGIALWRLGFEDPRLWTVLPAPER